MDESIEKMGRSVSEAGMVSSLSFSSNSAAAEAVDAALPSLTCPACEKSTFNLLERIDSGAHTRLPLHSSNHPMPYAYYKTVAISCDNCGYVFVFEESKLKALAEANKKAKS